MKFRVTNIEWDEINDQLNIDTTNLPETFEIELPDHRAYASEIPDEIYEMTGAFVRAFTYARV